MALTHIILAVTIMLLVAMVYPLRILFSMEKKMARIEGHLEKVSKKVTTKKRK